MALGIEGRELTLEAGAALELPEDLEVDTDCELRSALLLASRPEAKAGKCFVLVGLRCELGWRQARGWDANLAWVCFQECARILMCVWFWELEKGDGWNLAEEKGETLLCG